MSGDGSLEPVSDLFLFTSAVRCDPVVAAWFLADDHPMRRLAEPWFQHMRDCGPDVRELMHDGCPTACAGEAAFAYVGAYSRHLNVGFFQGAALKDPAGLLEGAGKRMRHVKIRPGEPVDEAAIRTLIMAAYADMRARLQEAGEGA